MAKSTVSGEMTFDEEVTEGFKHDVSVNAKFHWKVSSEVSAGIKGVTPQASAKSDVGVEIGAAYNFSYTSTKKVKKVMKMPAGSKGYIYQAVVEARTNKGTDLSWNGGIFMHDEPLDLVKEIHL